MFKMFDFSFETSVKIIFLLIGRSINEALLVADHFNQTSFHLIDIPHWFLINMFLHVDFSLNLQVLVHWCGFHAARSESEWCTLLRCLAAQTAAARHLSSCWRFWLNFQHTTSHVRCAQEHWAAATQDSGFHTRHVMASQQTRPQFRRNSKVRQTSLNLMSCGY